MSKPDWKELFGEDSDDEEIIIPPMPKFKSKIQRRDNIEEDIPEDIPEPEILSFKLDSNDDSTDVLFFNPEDSMEEAAKGIEGMKLQDIEKIEKAEDRNSEAKALGYESWAAMKESKNEQKGRRAQNAGVWTGAASAAVGVAEGIRRLFDKDKQKRGGTIKSKKVTSRPKKRK